MTSLVKKKSIYNFLIHRGNHNNILEEHASFRFRPLQTQLQQKNSLSCSPLGPEVSGHGANREELRDLDLPRDLDLEGDIDKEWRRDLYCLGDLYGLLLK